MMSADPFIVVAGAGRWGSNHIRVLHELGALYGVAEPDGGRRAEVRERYPDVMIEESLSSFLENPEVRGVVVAAPAQMHHLLAAEILHHGKHVLVEKPLALTVEEGEHLVDLAEQNGLELMVGHILLYHPAIRSIREHVETGKLGRLQYIYSNRLNLGAVRKEENILWSFAPHDVSVLLFLTGCTPLSVTASGGAFLQPGVHDVTMTSLAFPGNVMAHIHVSWLHPFREHRLVVIGDRSMMVFEDSRPRPRLLLYPKGIDWIEGEPRKRDGDVEEIPFDDAEPLRLEMEHFLDVVRGNTSPRTDGRHGVDVLRVLERAQRSLMMYQYSGADAMEETNRPAARGQEPAPGIHPSVFIHPTAVVDEGVEIGEGTKIWHFSHVQSGAHIGKNCTLGQNVNVGNNVRIGDHCKIQNNVSVYEGVELEDYVFCGPSMVFTNVQRPRCKFPQRGSKHYVKTLVREGASIGANATILCGITIGENAFIGAGSVVLDDVPDHGLVVGNPGRIIGSVDEKGERI